MYRPPGIDIFQEVRPTLEVRTPEQNICLVGPQKEFLQYPEDKALARVGLYNGSEVTFVYPNKHALSIIELPSVSVIFDSVEARYFAKDANTGNYEFRVVSNFPNRITTIGAGALSFRSFINANQETFPRATIFNERDVRAGDILRISGTIGTATHSHISRIGGFANEILASEIQAITAGASNHPTQTHLIGAPTAAAGNSGIGAITLTTSGTYTGHLGQGITNDTYTIFVAIGGGPGVARLNISTATGTDDVAMLLSQILGQRTP